MNNGKLKLYTLKSKAGIELSVLNFGATITGIRLPLKDGLHNIVLAYTNPTHYLTDPYYLGSTIGRYANRINGACFTLNNKKVSVSCNDKGNHIHGGHKGFSRKYWQLSNLTNNQLTLSCQSCDGDQGFPGNLHTSITYTLDSNQLIMDYIAHADQATHVNLTNHCYFNLDKNKTAIDTHSFQINAKHITKTDENRIPTGELLNISGTEFDLQKLSPLKDAAPHWPIVEKHSKGYDHNYALNTNGSTCQFAAIAHSKHSGIHLKLYTTKPGLQFYTGNCLDKPFNAFQGFCFEPQYFPDTPNQPGFPSSLLLPNTTYQHKQILEFDW